MLGPASDSPAVVRRLFDAGVDIFRLNASHGSNEHRAALISFSFSPRRNGSVEFALQ